MGEERDGGCVVFDWRLPLDGLVKVADGVGGGEILKTNVLISLLLFI